MIIVTGAAGFIGSCIVARLNQRGIKDLVLVDHWDAEGQKKKNLEGKSYLRFHDKQEFLSRVVADAVSEDVSAVIHMGACSSTTGQDRAYYMRNNLEYSCHMARWALRKKARFIYASSAATYGDGAGGYADTIEAVRACRPLNHYGESKQKFDEWVLDNQLYDKMVGLKFFNVFGPNEYHKGDMKSVIAKAYDRVVTEGKMMLFKSHRPDYADGEQMRDFIYVKDVLDVIEFLLARRDVNGIFNVGTGHARTWNDVARALFAAAGRELAIEYQPMPETLRDKYQYFTEADMSRLRKAGYMKSFTSLEEAVRDYAVYLKGHSYF